MRTSGSAGLRLVGLARVKNEGDVIEEFVRYNLRFLDSLVVIDNLSFDGTRDILEALRSEGLPLTILDDPGFAHRQGRCVTEVAGMMCEQPFDFLFLLDADEFIKVPHRASLEAALAELPPGVHGSMWWTSYVPTKADASGSSVLRRITHRRRDESMPFSKIVIARDLYREQRATISQGNHSVVSSGSADWGTPLHGVQLAHLPVRSLQQVQIKALVGWTTYLAMGHEDEKHIGYQKRRLYEKLCANPAWDERDVYSSALTYLDLVPSTTEPELVDDPLPAPPSRYGDGSMHDLAQASIALTRQMARAIFELTDGNTNARAVAARNADALRDAAARSAPESARASA